MTPVPGANSSQAGEFWFRSAASALNHGEQLRADELFNGKAAMLGFLIGMLTESEAFTGQGILHQIQHGTLFSMG